MDWGMKNRLTNVLADDGRWEAIVAHCVLPVAAQEEEEVVEAGEAEHQAPILRGSDLPGQDRDALTNCPDLSGRQIIL